MKLINTLISLFEANRNEKQAVPMAKYMKTNSLFSALNSCRKKLLQKFYDGILREAFQKDFVLALWQQDEREYRMLPLVISADH